MIACEYVCSGMLRYCMREVHKNERKMKDCFTCENRNERIKREKENTINAWL